MDFNDFLKFGDRFSEPKSIKNQLNHCIQNGIQHQMAPRRSQSSQKAHKTAQETPKTPTRRPQDASKTPQDVPKTLPRRFQDGSKTAPRGLQDGFAFQNGPRRPQEGPKTSQEAPKTPPRRPTTFPRRPETPRRCPEDAPRHPKFVNSSPWAPCGGLP